MNSRALPSFWAAFQQLPRAVQASARQAFKRFQNDPGRPGLRFKHIKGDVWSVRVGIGYRALGHRTGSDEITWYWIGSHEDHNKLLR